jgi:hypothetical protein
MFKSRHLFEVEVLKYKSILERRKFNGQDEIEPILIVGRRGLLQNRRRPNPHANRSLTATESDVDKFYKKISNHNTYAKKQRGKFQTAYFERNPDKLEQFMKEEHERQREKTDLAMKRRTDEILNRNIPKPDVKYVPKKSPFGSIHSTKRSMSLGIRNKTFKCQNLSFNKEKPPSHRNVSVSHNIQPIPVVKKNTSMNHVKSFVSNQDSKRKNKIIDCQK